MKRVALGRSVYNPRWDERDSVPRGHILDGVDGGFVRLGKERVVRPPPPSPFPSEEETMYETNGLAQDVIEDEDVALEGGFLKRKFGKKSRMLQFVAPGTPALLNGLGEDEDEDADELAGIGIGALTLDEFKARIAQLVERDQAAAARTVKLTPVKAEAVATVVRRSRVPQLVARLQRDADRGQIREGLLMVAERRMSAVESVITDKEDDPIERPLAVERRTAMDLYRTRKQEMRKDARAARRVARDAQSPAYYGHQETAFLQTKETKAMTDSAAAEKPTFPDGTPYGRHPGRRHGPPPWAHGRRLRGGDLGFAGSWGVSSLVTKAVDYGPKAGPPATFGDYIDRVNSVASRWKAVQDKARAVSDASLKAVVTRAQELNVARRVPELVATIRGLTPVMDVVKLQKVEERLPLLENMVNLMVAQPPVIVTEDGENARTVEYLRGEVDRALAAKRAALAAQVGLFGISWKYWAIGGIGLAVLGGAIYALSPGRE